eukprot:CAMPEP_0116108520 /NCGR_PEP_ID=MMETSP0327-20121206/16832_1 /TAXON_ID=44447 /ORGANISM="Pseudo-nitzschia delicatissima, Strain B596" /LENGTH=112 /DNA_ID=CAMNT_0003601443 /DNA_START=352 /DNA_END=690 /DNA_ORIENTATION=-
MDGWNMVQLFPCVCVNYSSVTDRNQRASPTASDAAAAAANASSVGTSEVTTEYKTTPSVPKAITNKQYAVISAPLPKTRIPRESLGESSIPIITESVPVPKVSPNMMRLQNS